MKYRNGSPWVLLFAVGLVQPSIVHAQDRNWWSGFYRGPSFDVRAMTVYDGRLIIGGDFETIAGQNTPYIAAWDGRNWSVLGDGPGGLDSGGGQIRALGNYRGDLIAVGYLNHPGDVYRKYVKRWNGHDWAPIGGPFHHMIDCLAVNNGDLIVGGYFDTVGEDSCWGVARWDGTKWNPMGNGLVSDHGRIAVWALAADDGFVYAGGDFTHSGSTPVSGVARWNGVSWGPVGEKLDGLVWSMCVYKGDLIVGGSFKKAGATILNGIARWNGQSWEPMGEGAIGGGGGPFAIMDDKLFVGGFFHAGANGTASDIAVWNGTTWTLLGSGLGGGAVYYASSMAMQPYDGSLYVGGRFGTAGGEKSEFLARWSARNFAPSLAFFTAARQEHSVVLNWRSAGSLPKDATFRVYRSAADRDRTEISGNMSLSQGNASFIDPNPLASESQYWIATDAPYGTTNWFGPLSVASIEPPTFRLAQNRPNPVREGTTFFFEVTRRSEASLTIVDVTGRKVAEPYPRKTTDAGAISVSWNGTGLDGARLADGVYFYVLETGEGRESRKLILGR